MAIWQRTVTMDTMTLEGVVEWINTVHEGMLAVGCVQTDDLGQLDIENIPAPEIPSQNNQVISYGFRIYEINDSLSSTAPIYMKIEFEGRRNGTDATSMGYSLLTVSHSTDGSGGLGYPRIEANLPYRNFSGSYPSVVAPAAPCAACKKDGYLFLLVGCGYYNYRSTSYANYTATFFCISRLPHGVAVWHFHDINASTSLPSIHSTELRVSHLSPTVATPPQARGFSIPTTELVGGVLPAFPGTCSSADAIQQDRNILGVPAIGLSDWSVVSLSSNDYDSTSYLILPGAVNPSEHKLAVVPDGRLGGDGRIAVRWEP